jgi:hypothetical protein
MNKTELLNLNYDGTSTNIDDNSSLVCMDAMCGFVSVYSRTGRSVQGGRRTDGWKSTCWGAPNRTAYGGSANCTGGAQRTQPGDIFTGYWGTRWMNVTTDQTASGTLGKWANLDPIVIPFDYNFCYNDSDNTYLNCHWYPDVDTVVHDVEMVITKTFVNDLGNATISVGTYCDALADVNRFISTTQGAKANLTAKNVISAKSNSSGALYQWANLFLRGFTWGTYNPYTCDGNSSHATLISIIPSAPYAHWTAGEGYLKIYAEPVKGVR